MCPIYAVRADVLDSLAGDGIDCNCPLPYTSTDFQEQVYVAKWPSKAKVFNNENDFRESRKRKTRLKVFYSTFTQRTLEQKPVFEESEIFSHLGAELGLWLGLSLMTMFELVENAFYFGKYLISRKNV